MKKFSGQYRTVKITCNGRCKVENAANFEVPRNTATCVDYKKPLKTFEDVKERLSPGTDDCENGRM